MRRCILGCITLGLLLATASGASAHFLWLVPENDSGRVHVHFAESPDPDDPDLLDRLKDVVVRQRTADGKTVKFPAQRKDDWLAAKPKQLAGTFGLAYEYGVLERGDSVFLLQYNAKAYTPADPAKFTEFEGRGVGDLDVLATREDARLVFQARWKGQPVPGAEIKVFSANLEVHEGTTDERGRFAVDAREPGRYAARVKHVEDRAGKRGEKTFPQVRHYTTVTLVLGEASSSASASKPAAGGGTEALPDLPFGVTSFGGAVAGRTVYVFGGNRGGAHRYDKSGQNDELLALDLDAPTEWKVVGKTPRRQGLAMVAHGGKLYRIGGFEARNEEGEEQDLHSTKDFARFDPQTGRWEQLDDLPRGRSSHDAVVIGEKLYVAGGWDMQGDEKHWHETALVADLTAKPIQWKEFPVPFRRRALALGEADGRLYVIGGMQQEGGPTRKVSVYDPATKTWSEGPELAGEGRMGGFGSSAFRCGSHLYATTYDGSLQRLSPDGTEWTVVGELENPRFFHRLLTVGDEGLLAVGGASMGVGKILETELLQVAALGPQAASAAELMADAREGRAVWQDFPGFQARIVVNQDGRQKRGRLAVAADGSVSLDVPDIEEWSWVERKLKSVVNHRLPSDRGVPQVSFADDETDHPLGRLVKVEGDGMGSRFRVSGDVITEVHRASKRTKFTISVSEVFRTPDGKHLPQTYTVSRWDPQTKDLQYVDAVHDEWASVGHLHLPTRLLTVRTGNDGLRTVREIRLHGHRLGEPPMTAAETSN